MLFKSCTHAAPLPGRLFYVLWFLHVYTPALNAIDTFVDALWLEDGLSRNTLAAYRRDLTLYAQWLAEQQPPLVLDEHRRAPPAGLLRRAA